MEYSQPFGEFYGTPAHVDMLIGLRQDAADALKEISRERFLQGVFGAAVGAGGGLFYGIGEAVWHYTDWIAPDDYAGMGVIYTLGTAAAVGTVAAAGLWTYSARLLRRGTALEPQVPPEFFDVPPPQADTPPESA